MLAGFTGVVFCIDASPDTYPATVESLLREADVSDASQLQNVIVKHLYTVMTGSTSTELLTHLQEATTWKEKEEICVRAMQNNVTFSKQYARCVIKAAYYRICEALQYKPNQIRPLRSQIVLMRSEFYPHGAPDLYLGLYSERTPKVYELSSNHANILEDQRCANIINKYLDKKILHDFNLKNLCNTYLCKSLTNVGNSD